MCIKTKYSTDCKKCFSILKGDQTSGFGAEHNARFQKQNTRIIEHCEKSLIATLFAIPQRKENAGLYEAEASAVGLSDGDGNDGGGGINPRLLRSLDNREVRIGR